MGTSKPGGRTPRNDGSTKTRLHCCVGNGDSLAGGVDGARLSKYGPKTGYPEWCRCTGMDRFYRPENLASGCDHEDADYDVSPDELQERIIQGAPITDL